MHFTYMEPRNKCVLDTFTNLPRKISSSLRYVSLEEKNRWLYQDNGENHFDHFSHSVFVSLIFFLQKSWKRRFFVLLKYRDNKCQLKYYKNEEKNKPLGDIDLSTYVQYLHSALFISNWTCIISLKPDYRRNHLFFCLPFRVTYMFLYPEMHTMWKWIHNNFRCSSSCVMFIRVPERDYFLIGENRFVLNVFAFFRAVIYCSFFLA